MKTIKEIKQVYLEKAKEIAKRDEIAGGGEEFSIGTKKFIFAMGNYRVISTYLTNATYLGHPLVHFEFQKPSTRYGAPETEWDNVNNIPSEFHEATAEILKMMNDYWVSYFDFKNIPSALMFTDDTQLNGSILRCAREVIAPDNDVDARLACRPLTDFFKKMDGILIGSIPHDVLEEGERHKKAQEAISDYFNKQPLIIIKTGLVHNLLKGEVKFLYAGRVFNINFSENEKKYSEFILTEIANLASSNALRTWVITPDIKSLQNVFSEIVKTDRTLHLFDPPKELFKDFVSFMASSLDKISDQNVAEQFDMLESELGSWEAVEELSHKLLQLVKKNKTKAIYYAIDKTAMKNLLIERIPFKEKYYFVSIIQNGGNKEDEFEIFSSSEEVPDKVKDNVREFYESTLKTLN